MGRTRNTKHPLRRLIRAAAVSCLLAVGAVVAIDLHVTGSVTDRIHKPADAPVRSVIVVLGASVYRGGSPSPMLADRLRTAARLWRDGRAPLVLVSGDRDFEREYDEIAPMRRALEDLGVTAEAILEDPRGYRTLDSMARAKEVFGFADALVVTNGFHLARAVYLGQHFGLQVDGVVADEGVERPFGSRLRNGSREILARILAWLDCVVLGTRPSPDPAAVDGSDGRE